MGPTPPPADRDERLVTLMVKYQHGDLDAFDQLYAELAPRLRRFLTSLARDGSWADDLLQDTFLHLHRSRRTYDPPRPVEPWAFGIARHVFLMSRRSRARRRESAQVDAESAIAPATPGPEAAIIAKDQVKRSLAALSPGTRRAVLLHHLLGWDFKAIGERLGILGQTARLRSSRGMSRLRAELTDEEDDRER